MTMPAILPDWVPLWAQLALLVLAMLFAVALLMMPFAVFGLKGRFDLLEAQLDDIHAELRMLAMRLPDAEPPRPARRVARGAPPAGPIAEPDDDDPMPAVARRPVRAEDRTRPLRASDREGVDRDGPDRSEPRLRWPPASDRR